MAIVPSLESSKGLNELDPRHGIKEAFGNKVYPLDAGSKIAVERLQQHLGDSAAEVTPRFEITSDKKARLVELHTGPQIDAVAALNKLNALLKGSGMEKTNPEHDFNREQTAAILENLPRIGRQH